MPIMPCLLCRQPTNVDEATAACAVCPPCTRRIDEDPAWKIRYVAEHYRRERAARLRVVIALVLATLALLAFAVWPRF